MINRQRAILKSVMIVFFSTTLYVYLFRSKHIEKILPGLLATFLSLLKSSSRNNMPAHEIIVRDKPVTKLKPIEYCTEISADLIQAESLSFAAARHLLQAPGSEFRINNFFILSQSNVQVLPSLSPVNPTQWAVYTSEGFQDPSGLALALQRLDSAGEKVGTEVRVNSQVGGDQFNARTCMTNLNGDFRAVFQTTTSGSGLNSPRVRDFNPNGIPQGDEYSLNVITEGDQSNAVCAGNMVVWTSNHLGLNKLFARCKVGGVWQETVAVANISNAYQQQPSLINSFDFLSQLVVFESNHTGISEIYAQAFNTTCNALTSTIPISQAGGTLPSVTVLDNSEYVTSYLQNNEIKAQRLDADYTRTGAQVAVANDVSVKTSVAPLTSGGFAVGYESADNVYVQYFDYGNTPWFDAVEVGFSGNARRPSLGFMQSIYSPIDSLGSMLVVSDHNDDIWGFIYNAPPVIRFTSVGSIPIPIERSEVPLNQDKFIGDPDHYVLSSAVLTTNITQDVFAITNVNPIFSINGNASDTLALSGQASFATYLQELNKITYRPDHNQPGDRVITYTLTDPSDAQGSADIVANVSNLVTASPPILNVNASFALEDQWASLDIQAQLIAPEDETLSIEISNIPVDSMLRYSDSSSEFISVPIVNNAIHLQAFQLNQLQIMLREHGSGVFSLQVEASAMDKIGGSESTIKTLALTVEAVADMPILTAQDAVGLEDQPIALNVSAALTDDSEILAVEFDNVPVEAVLDQGTLVNTVWHLTSEQLINLMLTPALNFKGQIPLQVRAISTETSNLDTAVQIRDFNVEVIAVADMPIVTVQNVTGFEDQPILLDVSAALSDSSESLTIEFHNVPAEAVLDQGTLVNTVWHLTSEQLVNLMLTPALNFKGQIPLQVRAISTEIPNSDTAVQIRDFNVEVIAVEDPPSFSPIINAPAVIETNEDAALNLNISVIPPLINANVSVVLSNLFDSMRLSYLNQALDRINILISAGKAALRISELNELMLLPQPNYAGSISMQVTAETYLKNTLVGQSEKSIILVVHPVADAPVANDVTYSLMEDSTQALQQNYLQYVTDVDSNDRAILFSVNGDQARSLRSQYGDFIWFSNGNFSYSVRLDNVRYLDAGEFIPDCYNLTVRDNANLTATGRVTFNIYGVNSAPIIIRTISSALVLNVSQPFAFDVDHFCDPENHAWSLQVNTPEDSAIPSWMSVNASDHTISGFPDSSQIVTVILTALDEHSAMSLPLLLNIQVNAGTLQPPPQSSSNSEAFPWLLAGLIAGSGIFGVILIIASIRSYHKCRDRRILNKAAKAGAFGVSMNMMDVEFNDLPELSMDMIDVLSLNNARSVYEMTSDEEVDPPIIRHRNRFEKSLLDRRHFDSNHPDYVSNLPTPQILNSLDLFGLPPIEELSENSEGSSTNDPEAKVIDDLARQTQVNAFNLFQQAQAVPEDENNTVESDQPCL